jgi:hypothetical protein
MLLIQLLDQLSGLVPRGPGHPLGRGGAQEAAAQQALAGPGEKGGSQLGTYCVQKSKDGLELSGWQSCSLVRMGQRTKKPLVLGAPRLCSH